MKERNKYKIIVAPLCKRCANILQSSVFDVQAIEKPHNEDCVWCERNKSDAQYVLIPVPFKNTM